MSIKRNNFINNRNLNFIKNFVYIKFSSKNKVLYCPNLDCDIPLILKHRNSFRVEHPDCSFYSRTGCFRIKKACPLAI